VAGEEEEIRSSERKTISCGRRGRPDPVATATATAVETKEPHSSTADGRPSSAGMTGKDEMPTTVVTSGGTPTSPNYRQHLMRSRRNSRESSKNAGKILKKGAKKV
jgi:hypothetical protein